VEGGAAPPPEAASGEAPPVNPVNHASLPRLRGSLRPARSSRVGLLLPLNPNPRSTSFLAARAPVTRRKSQEWMFPHLQAAGGALHFRPGDHLIGGAIVFSVIDIGMGVFCGYRGLRARR